MKEQVISFETANLAKKKGFDLEVQYTYADDEGNADFFDDWENWNSYEDDYSAPTQSLLQKWIREKHEIDIFIEPFHIDKKSYYVLHGVYNSYETRNFPVGDRPTFDTYEQALEVALQEALKLITT